MGGPEPVGRNRPFWSGYDACISRGKAFDDVR